ncbi:MAG: 2-(1,2-epoxy-1,2-dihydrophenyl)acetyl-CoA isomerase [Chitinophagaceae bacterium]|nr:MAG: 2-(1,2-epoxy-1,2-dihydrophenyl)acetyl-CoA isomerase [Chitinophagaceae bacterium]
MYNTLKYELKNGVATISLNRPEVYNAFNEEMSFDLQKALKEASKDDNVRVLVLTGEGKAFCSGQDLKDIKGKLGDRNLGESVHKRYNPIISSIRKMPKPVICRLNGVAAGAGCSLALACDIVIAAENVVMTEVFIKIGLVLDSGSSYFLPRLMGYHRAFELATKGDKITAVEALEFGMVNKVVPADQLDRAVKELTDYYAKAPTKAVGLIKSMLNKSYHKNLEEMLNEEAYAQEIAGYTADYKEGVTAFLEKRPPEYKGK